MATVMDRSDVRQALRDIRESQDKQIAAIQTLRATLTDEQRSLLDAYGEACTECQCAETELFRAMLLAHAGPLATILRPLLDHCDLSRGDLNCDCPVAVRQ